MQSNKLLVQKSVTIKAPVSHVFKTLTEDLDSWWPRSHHIGRSEPFKAILEPGVGGRWYEKGADGTECDWGVVQVWEPPYRIVLSWDISAGWQHDPNLQTEVEIRLFEAPDGTRLDLEHRKLERYEDKAEEMRNMFDSPGGWSGVLESLSRAVS